MRGSTVGRKNVVFVVELDMLGSIVTTMRAELEQNLEDLTVEEVAEVAEEAATEAVDEMVVMEGVMEVHHQRRRVTRLVGPRLLSRRRRILVHFVQKWRQTLTQLQTVKE